jgi:hypothetical protein
MKKVLSTVAALGLVAGLASTAAAVEFTMSGKYIVEGYSLSDTESARAGADLTGPTDSDAYWMHTFQIKPTMKVNDKISMKADIRMFKESPFGTTSEDGQSYNDEGNGFDIDKLWMEYMSPIGKWTIGRVEVANFGGKYLDSSTSGNRIIWEPSFVSSPWGMKLLIQKLSENDVNAGAAPSAGSAAADQDSDLYKGVISHKTENGTVMAAWNHYRNATTAADEPLDYDRFELWGKYKIMSDYTIEFEIAQQSGDRSNTVGATESDWDAWAAMLDVSGKFGALTPGIMYFYAQGDDNTTDGDREAYMQANGGTGDDFQPLYILTGDHTGLLNDDLANFGDTQPANLRNAGVHAVVLHADYAVSDRLKLHGAVAYAQADQELAGYDDEYGWEYNVGAAYKLLDNLTYEAHFGFLDTGDFFKGPAGTDDTNDITLMSHHLTMSF